MAELKNSVNRRLEIIDVAEKLFLSKGYQQSTIVDILNELGIAKGTFYYYFKSKEELMDEIIERLIREDVKTAKIIAKDSSLSVLDKFFRVFFTQKPQLNSKKSVLLEEIHLPNNVEMHQKSIVLAIKQLAPVLKEIIEEGIEEGVFITDYPQETMELLMISGQILFDKAWFSWTDEEFFERARAFVFMMENSLGVKKGKLDFILEILFT